MTRTRGGGTWRIGTDAEVAWIADGTSPGRAITAAIPPVFDAYGSEGWVAESSRSRSRRRLRRRLARFDGHTADVYGVAALEWPGLGHPVVVTASRDETARVWDPRDPSRELARLDGHTGDVWGVAVLGWPGLDHQVVVTTSSDQTARVWDPQDPSRELARLMLFGRGFSVFAINEMTLAFASSRGYLVIDLQSHEFSRTLT